MWVYLLPFLFLVTACSQPDPQPELKDPIYQDMKAELDIAEKGLAEAKKSFEEHQKNLGMVKPQTGQIKYAQKRYFEAERAVTALEQQKKYWIIRMDERKRFVRRQSLIAFNKGEKWDNSAEVSQFEVEKRLRRAKLKWDVDQRRQDFLKQNVPRGTASTEPAPSEH